MFEGLPALSVQQQQQAVEKIHQLMSQGISSGEAICRVAQEIRQNFQGETIAAWFDDE